MKTIKGLSKFAGGQKVFFIDDHRGINSAVIKSSFSSLDTKHETIIFLYSFAEQKTPSSDPNLWIAEDQLFESVEQLVKTLADNYNKEQQNQ